MRAAGEIFIFKASPPCENESLSKDREGVPAKGEGERKGEIITERMSSCRFGIRDHGRDRKAKGGKGEGEEDGSVCNRVMLSGASSLFVALFFFYFLRLATIN